MSRVINVKDLTRVEGHGRIRVELGNGCVQNVELNIFEGPRFFEAILKGRRYEDVPSIVCRICAICSASHKLTSIMALEDALGVKVSRQTELLRELLVHGTAIESHVLHLYFLALPDFLNAPSAIALAPRFPYEVDKGLRLKKLGNQIQETVGGRAIHPENPVVGGFGKVPRRAQLEEILKLLEDNMEAALEIVKLFGMLKYPDYAEAPTTFYALEPGGNQFGYYGKTILCSSGERIPIARYREVCAEKVVEHSTAKHSLPGNNPFMVGSIARVNLLGDRLTGLTRKAMDEFAGGVFPSDNPLHNNLAQAIEVAYSFERAIQVIKELFENGYDENEKPVAVEPRAGKGVGALEVPRGTLYHEYELNDDGRIVRSNIVTPTAQNCANIERDIVNCCEKLYDDSDENLTFNLEMIARAYDPCISCSTHMVEVVRRDSRS